MSSPATGSRRLTDEQAHALLDILSHAETYSEIRNFRFRQNVDDFGPPFSDEHGKPSSAPALQALFSQLLLTLPGLKDVGQPYWRDHIAPLTIALQEAELSESYDRGLVGIRKTLATAEAALLEYPLRGIFAGFDPRTGKAARDAYDLQKPEDLQAAFLDLLHDVVYNDMLDELVERTAATDKVEDHAPVVVAAHEFILVNLASFMHYTLIISPKGQNILTMIDQASRLTPWGLIKQTLKIGNVASMINGMLKISLAKVSVGTVTNMIGWTSGADEGQNLLQHIISTVLYWDGRDFRSRVAKIEKGAGKHHASKPALQKDQIEALKQYPGLSPEKHEELRTKSARDKTPIVHVILRDAGAAHALDAPARALAQDYLAARLALRDREQIARVLCHSNPDHVTAAMRVATHAYEPLIRATHNATDLSGALGDLEAFIKDTIKLAKVPAGAEGASAGSYLYHAVKKSHKGAVVAPPTVGDFVALLKKHQAGLHRFLHQVTKNAPSVTDWFADYLKHVAAQFRRRGDFATRPDHGPSAGSLTPDLEALFASLPRERHAHFLHVLDRQTAYIDNMHAASAQRLRAVIESPVSRQSSAQSPTSASPSPLPWSRSASAPGSQAQSPAVTRAQSPVQSTVDLAPAKAGDANPGPGAFLARWQSLIDESHVSPFEPGEGVRSARAVQSKQEPAGLFETESGDSAASKSTQADSLASEVSSSVASPDDSDSDGDVFEEAREQLDQLGLDSSDRVDAPLDDTRELVSLLLIKFRQMLAEKACNW